MRPAPAALSLLLAASLACRARQVAPSGAERASTEAGVRAAVSAFADAERRRDPEAVISFLSADFYMYVDGVRADHDTVVDGIRATLGTLRRMDTTWSDIEVLVLARDHALVSLVFEDAITSADGTTTHASGPTTFLWSLVEGRWLLRYADADHYSQRGEAR